jgi:hypothetical protein
MKFPSFLRRWAAMYLVWNKEEIGGILYDYANGKWNVICRWNTDADLKAAKDIVANAQERDCDEIYITSVATNGGAGLFIVEDSHSGYFFRAYHPGVYEVKEALIDTAAHCRKIADKMGYRRPDDEREDYIF